MKIDTATMKRLNKLRKQLDRHYPKVAARSKVSVSTVCRVLNGKHNNDEVLKMAIKVRDEVMRKKAEMINAI